MTFNLTETSVAKSRPSVPYGANLFSDINRVRGAAHTVLNVTHQGAAHDAASVLCRQLLRGRTSYVVTRQLCASSALRAAVAGSGMCGRRNAVGLTSI